MSESNNNTPMRITQLEEATAYEDGMYYAVAKAGSGTKKVLADAPTLSEESIINDHFVKKFNSDILVSSNYIKASDGTLVPSGGSWKASGYINVKNYGYIYLTMATVINSNDAGIAFYDVNKNYISGVESRVSGVASYEKRLIKVPQNAEFLVVSFRDSDKANFFLCYGDKLTNLYDNIYIYADIARLHHWESGTLNNYGQESDFSGFFRTEYISVETGTELNIEVGENAVFVFEYRGEGQFISTDPNFGGKRYTEDATHTLQPLTTLIRLVTRTEPYDQSSDISIVNNISVNGKAFSIDVFKNNNSNNSNNVGLCFGIQMFKKIGVIGDSIACGWLLDKQGNRARRNLDISWVQQMARRLGCDAYNLGASGVDPIEWFQSDYEYYEFCYPYYQSTGFCDLYIIGLGLNQGTLGTISDINENDYTQNGSTFYGQYARIIQMINAEHPNAIVMCLTKPTTAISSYDQAVRNICALNYINAELVDLENNYFDLFNTAEIKAQHQPDGLHFTPYGYSLIAEAMVEALNDYISKNASKFKYVGLETT